MGSRIDFCRGLISDAGEIVRLVNSAYRGESSKAGWTTEADLLGGQRTDIDEVSQLIEKPDSLFLLCLEEGELAASIHLERWGNMAKFGMLAVRPALQGRGIGKRLLLEAESWVRFAWQSEKVGLNVLVLRDELIAYYERRGYGKTGRLEDFPEDLRFGIPKVPGLRFEWLEKTLNPPISAHS